MTGEAVIIAPSEIINDDLFIVGSTVDIQGVVNGDVYVAAQKTTVSGDINGDLFIASRESTVTGKVNDDLRVAGSSLVLSGAKIKEGVMFFGETLDVDKDSEINAGIIFYGKTLALSGVVDGKVRVGARSALINGTINNDAYITADKLDISKTAVIEGNLEYTSKYEASVAREAVIKGEVSRHATSMNRFKRTHNTPFRKITTLWSLLGAFVAGSVLLIFFGKQMNFLSQRIISRPLRLLGSGILIFLAIMPIILVLIMTIIGIPIALLLLAVFITTLFLSEIFVSFALGSFTLKYLTSNNKKPIRNSYLSLLLGLIILYFLYPLPVVGPIVRSAVIFLGLGAFFLSLLRLRGEAK